FPGVPVRGVGRQARTRGDGLGDVRHLRRGLIPPASAAPLREAESGNGRPALARRDPPTEATMPAPMPPDRSRELADFAGTLLLVGAGKRGGAMLEGWIALGINPARVIVLEPQPSRELAKLRSAGLRLNPERREEADIVVIAVKPQSADEVVP